MRTQLRDQLRDQLPVIRLMVKQALWKSVKKGYGNRPRLIKMRIEGRTVTTLDSIEEDLAALKYDPSQLNASMDVAAELLDGNYFIRLGRAVNALKEEPPRPDWSLLERLIVCRWLLDYPDDDLLKRLSDYRAYADLSKFKLPEVPELPYQLGLCAFTDDALTLWLRLALKKKDTDDKKFLALVTKTRQNLRLLKFKPPLVRVGIIDGKEVLRRVEKS